MNKSVERDTCISQDDSRVFSSFFQSFYVWWRNCVSLLYMGNMGGILRQQLAVEGTIEGSSQFHQHTKEIQPDCPEGSPPGTVALAALGSGWDPPQVSVGSRCCWAILGDMPLQTLLTHWVQCLWSDQLGWWSSFLTRGTTGCSPTTGGSHFSASLERCTPTCCRGTMWFLS